jgi:outer membrane protein assembly factor BamB
VNRLSLVSHRTEASLPLGAPPVAAPPDPLGPVRAALEPLFDGVRVSARLGHAELGPLLCSLAHALAELARGIRPRAVVRLCALPDPWDAGLSRDGRDVLLSVFLGGLVPEVALHERRHRGDALAARVLTAIASLSQATWDPSLAGAAEELRRALPFDDAHRCQTAAVAVEPTGDVPIVISAEVSLRVPEAAPSTGPAVMRADLLSLLMRGRLRVVIGEHARDLPEVLVFLLAEQLVSMTADAVEAWTRGAALHRRVTVGGAICGIRVNPKGAALLTLGLSHARAADDRAQTWTFPALDVAALAQGVVAFARALARSLVRRDRAQAHNLRLVSFRSRVRELGEALRASTRNESKINASPESYRAFAQTARTPRPSPSTTTAARLRYSPRWLANVPAIDLASTFLCGEVLLVGCARELYCIDRLSGHVAWRRDVQRGVSVVSPVGLARLESNGTLGLHDLSSGELLWSTQLAPRVGATASGAVVNAPGLPRLLVVSEGTRHLAAVDLEAGEVRWRHAARRGGVFLVRRAGKLVVVANGEPALTALDVLTGEVVWRFCDPLRFASRVSVGGDALLAFSGEGTFVGRGGARLHELDAWTGAARWSVGLPAHVTPVGAPLLAPETAVVVTHGRRGTGLLGIDRKTGATRFDRAACQSAASCMVVDDTVVINSESGELLAIDAADGTTRWRHMLPAGGDGDRPRRLEPVLRSGALFVPHVDVTVVRPRDGVMLGRIETDLIPDLLRVDERCDVYVAEESGHLGVFAAGPRLALVKA